MVQLRVLPVSMAVAMLLCTLAVGATTAAAAGPIKRVAGKAVTCKDFAGRTVHLMRVTGLGDVARAWVVNRVPFIVMDRNRLAKLPPKLQLFFFQHECAHHKMGHWMNTTLESERDADCMSIQEGRDSGLFTRDEVESFAPFFKGIRGSNVGHMPGPMRAKYLVECFDKGNVIAAKVNERVEQRQRTIVNTSARD